MRPFDPGLSIADPDVPCFQMVYYYKCIRFLLHPLLSSPKTHIALIKQCAEACGGVCQTYKKLHQNISVGFSLMALHSVFLAGEWIGPTMALQDACFVTDAEPYPPSPGLTIVYCIWIAPQEVFSITTSNDMMACSIVLYIITERWPGAKKYRDVYEEIMQSVVDSIEESKYEPRRTIKRLNTGRLFKSMTRNEEGRAEVSQMVADMVGEPMPSIYDFALASVPTAAATATATAATPMAWVSGAARKHTAPPPSHTDQALCGTMVPGHADRTNAPRVPVPLPATALDFQPNHGVYDTPLASIDDLEMFHAFDIGGIDMAGFDMTPGALWPPEA